MDCNGDCCVAFRVPYTLEELASGDVGSQDAEEARCMAAMLRPLTVEEANQRALDFIEGVVPTFDQTDAGHLYMCSNWNEETRRCNIYEDRPPMCSAFPYGEPCRYGCSCVGERPDAEVII